MLNMRCETLRTHLRMYSSCASLLCGIKLANPEKIARALQLASSPENFFLREGNFESKVLLLTKKLY